MAKLSLALKITIAVIVLIGVFFGLSYFLPGRGGPETVGVSTVGYQSENLSSGQLANREFIALLEKINDITLTTTVLDSLKDKFEDFSPTLPKIPAARSNPFAPIGERPASTQDDSGD